MRNLMSQLRTWGMAAGCVAGLLVISGGTAQAEPKLAPETKIKALLITGGCCHDYDGQKQIITQGLAQRISIKFDVIHEGGTTTDHKISIYNNPDWAKGYDVILHNECFSDVKDEEFIKKIIGAHHSGIPGVFIHCAMHSYRDTAVSDQWRELLGVTSRRHESHHPEEVKTVNAEHPVMKGFPAEWKTPKGELYVIEKVWPNCTPLAQAVGDETKKAETVVWVNTFAKTKVFGTTLGHHNETMNSEEWLGVVSRGVLWTLGKLKEDGKPAAGYEGTGVKPISLTAAAPTPTPDPISAK